MCQICKGKGTYTGVNQETNHVGPMRCECTQSQACSACQAGNCCGSCWCCFEKGRRLAELRAQHERIEQAIAETEPAFRGGLYWAAGVLVAEMRELS